MKLKLKVILAALLGLVAAPAFATATVDYASLVTSAMVEVSAAVAAGVTLFAIAFGIRVGLRILKKFSS